ncbi:MAG TPA: hypothetical protein VMC85_24005 [Desulfomonilaceae bacterium]|nr:hypothetical protein [Desulfomonilaceae bacterium]
MSANDYSVKLYGHGSRDPKEFCDDLARVLGIPVDEAEDLLNQLPVVVKRGMQKADAEEVCTLLRSSSAWCILETPDGESITDDEMEKPAEQATVPGPPARHLFKRDKAHPRLWLGILLGVTGLLGLFVLVGLLGSMETIGRAIPAKKPVTIQSDQTEESQAGTTEEETAEAIQARIHQLESSLASLYARRTEVQESRDLADAGYLERDLQEKIRTEYRELQALKSKLNLIQSREQR